jgi:DNA polymerase
MTYETLHIDFETRSAIDLTKVGVHRYAEDPTTGLWCFSYRFDDGPVQHWVRGQPWPKDVNLHIGACGRVVAHNAGFERAMWNAFNDFVNMTIKQQDCTMARARIMGLPGSLGALAKALNANVKKDDQGYRLMMKMCRPKAVWEATGRVVWHEDPEDLKRLVSYCDTDVLAECDVDAMLPPLSPYERRVWELDQRINDRGVALDVDFITKAQAVAEEAIKRANKKIWRLTDGAVKKVTEAARVVTWIKSRGIPCESIAEGEHEDLIICSDMFDDPLVEEVIRLRAASAKAFKFPAMLAAVCSDGRVRGSLGYAATVQHRWAGRGVQFHNMKRVAEGEENDVILAIHTIKSISDPSRALDRLELLFDTPLHTLSTCTRASVVSSDDCKLMGGDFSNIEGRLNAWMAGEQWKLQAFRDFDAGVGPDLYKVTAGNIIGIPPEEVSKNQRQEQGKVPELACGYQGALGAFKKMGAKYGVRLSDKRIHEIVQGWRLANPMITQSWREYQDAAIEAVGAPGCVVSILGSKVKYVSNGDFLFCLLPSGHIISYASPSVAWKTKVMVIDGDEVEFNRYTVSYWGEQKGWRQLDLYGGAQCAHVVSGTARDVLCEAMFRLEEAGYPIVLTIHDETLSEVLKGYGSLEEYKALLMKKSEWLAEVPIAANVWEGPVYAH